MGARLAWVPNREGEGERGVSHKQVSCGTKEWGGFFIVPSSAFSATSPSSDNS